MTGDDRANQPPRREAARRLRFGGGPVQGFQKAHERPLAEMMSVSDWRSFVPESIALLVVIWLIRAAVDSGHIAPGSMPHPYWIPVLLMSSQYGVMGGLFATLAAIASFFVGGLPAQSATQDFYAYAGVVAGQPCAWFGTALVLGGLRTLHIHHQTELQEHFDQTRVAAEDLAHGLESAVGEIARLERRIAVDASTLTSFTHSLAKLELSDRPSMLAGIADVIRHGVGVTSFAVYLKGARGLEPVLGVENGSRLAPMTITPLARSLLDEIHSRAGASATAPATDGVRLARTPHWSLIRLAGAVEPVGVVVCDCLQTPQDSAIAARRLDDVCQLLAILLTAHPQALAGA